VSEARPEFVRRVPLARLGGESFRQHIAADEGERAALAARFGLVSLDRLEADVELVREIGGTMLMTAAFTAEFAQHCIVTLDPVSGSVSERFQLRYGPADAEADAPNSDEDPAFEPFTGEAIDIGEAVAQEFSLALPPFPRAADAVVEGDVAGASVEGPFAVLESLARREPQ
jgi:uncharacterized metal-binding protein YceD (DUF177 family)